MNTQQPQTRSDNVVDLLKEQHQAIRELFDAVDRATGNDRVVLFRSLVRVLAMHETAEEEIVHPATRRTGDAGETIVKQRLAEEEEAKQALAALEDMDPGSPEFATRLDQVRRDVIQHAEHEEHEEFPTLLASYDEARLRRMGKAVRAAEAIAPTHPHPGTDTAAKNLLMGPVAAVVDRVRDAIARASGETR